MSAVWAAAVFCLGLSVSAAVAHGGLATLQVGPERVNPGGTVEVIGDMTTADPVDVRIVAKGGGVARGIGTIAPDEDGHFQANLVVPADTPVGSYAVIAGSGADQVSASIAVAGTPIGPDGAGQLPGQDEALAGAVPSSSVAPAVVIPVAQPPDPGLPGVDVGAVALAVLVALGSALAIGAFARAGSGRSDR